MGNFLGAHRQLSDQIDTHLFLICPNSSGSTYLSRTLALSRHIWSLKREGQHTMGYGGPHTLQGHFGLIWASRPEWVELFSNPENYNWEKTRKAWYFQVSAHGEEANVFLTKSPPFLLIADQLVDNFSNTKFIFMVRDPYATIEGICRRRESRDGAKQYNVAARHLMNCFDRQKSNIERYNQISTFFTYEDFCAAPRIQERAIQKLVPKLDDLELDRPMVVKHTYNEPLRNMNPDQIGSLDGKAFRAINAVLENHLELLNYFGYALRDDDGVELV